MCKYMVVRDRFGCEKLGLHLKIFKGRIRAVNAEPQITGKACKINGLSSGEKNISLLICGEIFGNIYL